MFGGVSCWDGRKWREKDSVGKTFHCDALAALCRPAATEQENGKPQNRINIPKGIYIYFHSRQRRTKHKQTHTPSHWPLLSLAVSMTVLQGFTNYTQIFMYSGYSGFEQEWFILSYSRLSSEFAGKSNNCLPRTRTNRGNAVCHPLRVIAPTPQLSILPTLEMRFFPSMLHIVPCSCYCPQRMAMRIPILPTILISHYALNTIHDGKKYPKTEFS